MRSRATRMLAFGLLLASWCSGLGCSDGADTSNGPPVGANQDVTNDEKPTGSAMFPWSIRVGSEIGPPAPCADGETVELAFLGLGLFPFDCSDKGGGISLPADTYEVDARLVLNDMVKSRAHMSV